MKTLTVAVTLTLFVALFAGSADAQTYTITNTLTTGTVGTPVVGALVTTNGLIPTIGTTYAVTTGSLPSGVALSTQGVFSGTPTKVEVASFTVTATVPARVNLPPIPPQNAGTATLAIKITIKAGAPALTIETTTLPDGQVGAAYSAAVVVKGGKSPYLFATNPLNLPTGVILDPTKGTLSGTPTTEGSYTFTIYATDTTLPPNTANRQFTVNVTAGPTLTASGTTEWTVDQPGFDLTVTASGGDGTYSFDAPTGVPAGLTVTVLSDRVTLTGTPTTEGETAFSVTVRDGSGQDVMLETRIQINPPVVLEDDAPPAATLGAPYGGSVEAEHGAPPYSFRIVTTDSTWLGIDAASGTFTGTPDTTDSVTVTVAITDATGGTDEEEFTFDVNDAPSLSATILPIGTVGAVYSTALPVTGGTAPFTFSIEAGELMRGLTFAASSIDGTPELSGYSKLMLRVTDRWGATSEAEVELTVGLRVSATGRLPEAELAPEKRRAYIIDLLAGTTFDVSLKVKTGTSGFYARLLTIDGTTVDTTAYEKIGKKSLKLRKFPIETTGRYVLMLENASDFVTADWTGKLKSKPAKKWKLKPTFGPLSDDLVIPFSALKDATITLTAKVTGKDVPVAELVEIVNAAGDPLDLRAFFVAKGTGFKVAKLAVPKSGDYRIRIRPDGTGSADGVLKIQLKVKSPKVYDYSAD